MPKKQEQRPTLETQYAEFFTPLAGWPTPTPNQSLQQPSPLKVVPSVVTYGAYEEPILGSAEGIADAKLE